MITEEKENLKLKGPNDTHSLGGGYYGKAKGDISFQKIGNKFEKVNISTFKHPDIEKDWNAHTVLTHKGFKDNPNFRNEVSAVVKHIGEDPKNIDRVADNYQHKFKKTAAGDDTYSTTYKMFKK